MLIVILLDWENPWSWVRQLREWIRLLRSVLISLDDETKLAMEEVMTEWRDRKRGADPSSSAVGTTGPGGQVSIPMGPGEWDEGLGIPMCVVCQGVCWCPLLLAAHIARADLISASNRQTKSRSWKRSMDGVKKNLTSSYSL
jgi:hypothetical protein